MGPVVLDLPWPPSLNRYYRHVGRKVLISRDGRQYREAVAGLLGVRPRQHLRGRLRMDADLYPPDRRRRDLDNTLKSLQDSLQHAGVFLDDSQIDDLRVRRRDPAPPAGRAVVRLEELDAAED